MKTFSLIEKRCPPRDDAFHAAETALGVGVRKTARTETDRTERSPDRMAQTILVPVEFTKSSAHAVDHAFWLAKQLNASIVLLHVLEPAYTGAFAGLFIKHKVREAARRWATEKFRELVESRANWRVPIQCIVRDGVPEYEILRVAEQEDVSLIVLGRHSRNPLSRFFFGSVSSDVADFSSRPVLVITGPVVTLQFQPQQSRRREGLVASV